MIDYLLVFFAMVYVCRPTLPVHWWYEEEKDNILAGKDLTKGGTWFGCTNSGRIALVTTFRDTIELDNPSSRGELIVSFLKVVLSFRISGLRGCHFGV